MLKNISSYVVCILLLLMVGIIADNNIKIAVLQAELTQMKSSLSNVEKRQAILKIEVTEKTNPKYVDQSLREYFSRLLREDTDQVRGVDGKMPRER